MSDTSETLSAIRRLSAGRGESTQRQADAEALADGEADEARATRALVQGLWDDDREVRRVCKRTLRRQFREMDTEGRQLVLDVLLVNLAGDADPPRQVVSLLSSLVGWVRNHRASEPHLFSTLVTEAERSRRGGSYPPRIRSALKDLYQRTPSDDSATADIVSNFNQQRSLKQLLSDTAPPEEVKSALRVLGDPSLSETDFDVLLYHLIPLRNVKDQSVMVKALRNLEAWSQELPGDDEFELSEAVQALDAYQRTDAEQLPGRLRNEIALSNVAVETLGQELERLRDLPQYRQSLEHIIETLEGITGVREVVDELIDVAREETGAERRTAVETLCTILTGLDADIEEYPAIRYRDRVRYVTDDETESVDAEIRSLFQELGEAGEADEETVYAAVDELLRSQPDDLENRLLSLLEGREPDDPVVDATLDAVSDEAILSATRPIVDAVRTFADGDPEGAREAIRTLETLGHDDARERLTTLVDDAPSPVSSMARDALVRSGYYQNVRARDTSTRAHERARESEQRGEQKVRRKAARREDREQYKRLEGKLRRQLLTADQVLRDGLVEVLDRRISSLDTLVELYQENRRVEHLVQEASNHHRKLGQYLSRLDLGTDVDEGIEEEFHSIERGLSYLERLIDADRQRAATLDDRLDDVERERSRLESVDDPDDDERTRLELLRLERESLREISSGYRESARDREESLSTLRKRLQRKRDALEDADIAVSGSFTDIESAITFAETREREIGRLVDQRESEWERVQDAVQEREADLEAQLSTLRSSIEELESVQRDIDDTTRAIGEDRLAQQYRSQQSRDDQEAFDEIEPRARGEARHRNEVAVAQSNFHRHHREYLSFVRRYYEVRLSEVESGRFAEQYADSLQQIEQDVSEYYE